VATYPVVIEATVGGVLPAKPADARGIARQLDGWFFHQATTRHYQDDGAAGERPLTLSALGIAPGNETAPLGQHRVQHRVPSAERRIGVARAAPVGRPSLAVSQWQIGGDSLPICRLDGRGMICVRPGSRADLYKE
jgi:hypothetical protein